MVPLLRTLSVLAVLLSACATASSGDDTDGGDGDGDGGGDGDGDGGGNLPDADPLAPDAPPGQIDANGCDQQPCSLVPQCGCAPPTVCDLNGSELDTGGTECRAVSTSGTDTADCSVPEECAAGYTCLGPTGGQQCRRYCDGNADCVGAGSYCVLDVVYGSQSTPVCWDPPAGCAKVCSKSCDPASTAPPTCPAGFACHIYLDGTTFLTDCDDAPASGGGQGAACQGSSSCAAGYDCLITGGSDCQTGTCSCFRNCRYLPAGGECAALGRTCTRFAAPRPTFNGTEYGYCN